MAGSESATGACAAALNGASECRDLFLLLKSHPEFEQKTHPVFCIFIRRECSEQNLLQFPDLEGDLSKWEFRALIIIIIIIIKMNTETPEESSWVKRLA